MNRFGALTCNFDLRLAMSIPLFNYGGETIEGTVDYVEQYDRYEVKLKNGETFDFRLHDVRDFPADHGGIMFSIESAGKNLSDVTLILPLLFAREDDAEEEIEEEQNE
jgi:hypothetical protein